VCVPSLTPRRPPAGAALASLTEAIGRTPLLRLRRLEATLSAGPAGALPIELYAKLELFNPGGSVKDRAALCIIRDALAAKKISGSIRLLDSTSGNTGIAYAWIGAALGLPVTLVMPENVSYARKAIVRSYGAEVLFSDPLEGSDGAIRMARELSERHPARYHYVDQYANPSNPRAHFEGTGWEIFAATRGRVTHFIAGIGTSGTLMGTGARLKHENPAIRVVGVQPRESLHGLEGLKHLESSLVPPIFQPKAVDQMLFVDTDRAWDLAERLAHEEGVPVGHSGGAAAAGLLEVARGLRARGEGGVLVTIFPDKAERYIEPVLPRPA
jgi:S-sulfo-L-cysteine synthase (O-acetyl-L-serine-dependent)